MRRLPSALLGLLVLVSLVPGAALAARVHVRVEGKTQTIFGAAEPRLDAATPLEALEGASVLGEFYYHVQTLAFGPYVDQVGRFPADQSSGWVFKVNGASPPVGADKLTLAAGDRVLWYWASFGPTGGPETLRLSGLRTVTRSGGKRVVRTCYRVVAENDTGRTRPATGAVLLVDGRRVATSAGRACVGAHTNRVRATLAGAIRSNAVR